MYLYKLTLSACAVLAERARPYLLTTDAHSSTDYINAVYIDVRSPLTSVIRCSTAIIETRQNSRKIHRLYISKKCQIHGKSVRIRPDLVTV